MRIFVAYASERHSSAAHLAAALRNEGHDVFFDDSSLSYGQAYDGRIRKAIQRCHLFVFLISPESIESTAYTLSELAIMERRAPVAGDRVLPVIVAPVAIEAIPGYLRTLRILTPAGDLNADVLARVHEIDRRFRRARWTRAVGGALLVGVAVGGVLIWHWQQGRLGENPPAMSESLPTGSNDQPVARPTESADQGRQQGVSRRGSAVNAVTQPVGTAPAEASTDAAAAKRHAEEKLAEARKTLDATGLNGRLSAIDTLATLAASAEHEREVASVLAAFIRSRAPAGSNLELPDNKPVTPQHLSETSDIRPPDDIRQALNVITRRNRSDGEIVDLSRTNLQGADFSNRDLREVSFAKSNLLFTNFSRANVTGAVFDGANLCFADLSHATVTRARFVGAWLNWAHLYDIADVGSMLRTFVQPYHGRILRADGDRIRTEWRQDSYFLGRIFSRSAVIEDTGVSTFKPWAYVDVGNATDLGQLNWCLGLLTGRPG